MYGPYIGRGEQCVHCREVVYSSECQLSEVIIAQILCNAILCLISFPSRLPLPLSL